MNTYDIQKIMQYLPHRYPFLLIDRVNEVVPGEKVTALKNVTINEPFFQGHFPGIPVMPGVIILEAMGQAGGVLAYESLATDSVVRLAKSPPPLRELPNQKTCFPLQLHTTQWCLCMML